MERTLRKNKETGVIEELDPRNYRLEEIEAELQKKDTLTNKAKGVLGNIGNEMRSISGYKGRSVPDAAPTLSDKLSEIEGLKRERQKLKTETNPEIKRERRGMKSGGKVKSASARADGCAVKGKTRGRMV